MIRKISASMPNPGAFHDIVDLPFEEAKTPSPFSDHV